MRIVHLNTALVSKVLQDWSTHLYCWHAVVLWDVNMCSAHDRAVSDWSRSEQKHAPTFKKKTLLTPGKIMQVHSAHRFYYQNAIIYSQMFELGEVIIWYSLKSQNQNQSIIPRHHLKKLKMCIVKQTVFWICLFWICILAEASATQGSQLKYRIQWRFIKEL